MQPDFALILSAGLGTRMGEIGKVLPKVLWPIFSKSLLELQIDYCRDLGIKNIYINVHYLAEDIINHVKKIPQENVKITLLHEEPLLDSGGAIHNLAQRKEVNYQGNVLLVNADQFLFFDKKYFEHAMQVLSNSDVRASLFGITVNKNASYNETIVESEVLKDIQKPSGEKSYITYSGLGIVKLNSLNPVLGASKFFQTVVNFKNEKTYMITPEEFEYWDFGTSEIYVKNILKLHSESSKQNKINFAQFLSNHNVDLYKTDNFLNESFNSINLEGLGHFQKNMMIFKLINQKI